MMLPIGHFKKAKKQNNVSALAFTADSINRRYEEAMMADTTQSYSSSDLTRMPYTTPFPVSATTVNAE